jgi:cyclopropane fatty-acyl-phospholipid synthase-like methyltransferase
MTTDPVTLGQEQRPVAENHDISQRLLSDRFPHSSQYHPDGVVPNRFGSHPLWIAEWLAGGMDLQPGQRVLDLGCGKGLSSIFLARKFGAQVW